MANKFYKLLANSRTPIDVKDIRVADILEVVNDGTSEGYFIAMSDAFLMCDEWHVDAEPIDEELKNEELGEEDD